jgi:hypothetical protein
LKCIKPMWCQNLRITANHKERNLLLEWDLRWGFKNAKFEPSKILVCTLKVMGHWYCPSRPLYHKRSWVQTNVVLVNGWGLTLGVSVEHDMCSCKFILCHVKQCKCKYIYMILHDHKKYNFYLRKGEFHKFLVISQLNNKMAHCRKQIVLWDAPQLIEWIKMNHNKYLSSCKNYSK